MTKVKPAASLVIAVLALIVVSIGGTKVVLATTRHPTYRACANSRGVLTLLSHGRCASGHAVSLGARGPAGPRGAVGPSQILFGQDPDESLMFQSDQTYEALTLIRHVPPGNWLVTGSATVSGVAGVDIQCLLDPTATAVLDAGVDNEIGSDETLTVTTSALIRLPAASNVTLTCRGYDVTSTDFWEEDNSWVTAQRVGSIG
jgi:hypothetical protein